MPSERIVIIGSGFAGLSLATGLKKLKADIILVDKSNHHVFQPLLYQVATAALAPTKITYPIREIFRKQPNTTVIMGAVVHIDKKQKKILLESGESIGYDFLVVATGATHSYFGQNTWESFAPGLKTVADAVTIREKILCSFEIAERLKNSEKAEPYLHFVIIGGGPTGVEMAGAIVEIAKTSLRENFRNIRPEKAKVFLIEALPHILPSYSLKLSQKAQKDLESLGVTVITGKKVTGLSDEGVYMEDSFISSKNVIWAAGNQASHLLASLDSPLDKQGRLLVEPDLSVPGYPEIFIIGDAAHVKTKSGPLPATASVAIQEGKYVAKLLLNKTSILKRTPFVFKDKGSMATIGKGKAIAQIGKLEFSGLLAWIFWGFIHIIYLVGYRNRVRVLFEWLTLFVTGRRAARLILGTIDKKIPK